MYMCIYIYAYVYIIYIYIIHTCVQCLHMYRCIHPSIDKYMHTYIHTYSIVSFCVWN